MRGRSGGCSAAVKRHPRVTSNAISPKKCPGTRLETPPGMGRVNALMVVSLSIHAVIAACTIGEMPVLAAVLCASLFLSLLGGVMMLSGNAVQGGSLFIVGCVPFVPIGLMGIVAARRAIDGPKAQTTRSWRLEFSAEPKHGRGMGAVGFLLVLVGLLRPLQAQPSASLLLGVFFLLIARWWTNNPIVIVHFDHVDIQPSLLARRRVVRLSDVRELSIEGMTTAFFVLKNGKTVALPLKLLDPNQRWRLLQSLQELEARPRPEISSHE